MRVSAFESREKNASGTMEGYMNMCCAMRRTRWRAGASGRNGNVAIVGVVTVWSGRRVAR